MGIAHAPLTFFFESRTGVSSTTSRGPRCKNSNRPWRQKLNFEAIWRQLIRIHKTSMSVSQVKTWQVYVLRRENCCNEIRWTKTQNTMAFELNVWLQEGEVRNDENSLMAVVRDIKRISMENYILPIFIWGTCRLV